jgi:hypothetical protein
MHGTLSHKTRLCNAWARLDRLLDERTDNGELTQWVADVIHHFIDLAEFHSERYGSTSSALGAISGNTWLSPKETVPPTKSWYGREPGSPKRRPVFVETGDLQAAPNGAQTCGACYVGTAAASSSLTEPALRDTRNDKPRRSGACRR